MYDNSNTKITGIELSEFCKNNHIRVLSVIDSTLQWNDVPGDHVNMLVEFKLNRIPGFIKLGKIEFELTEILGCNVDLWISPDISHCFKQEVIISAEPLYT
jgi:predicted nucleotidyltransferase